MEYIPAEKTMIMSLAQDNKKKVKSPPISHSFSINTDGVYNYIIESLNNKKYEEVYKFLNQLKIVIRCVWKTMYTYSEYPDLAYINKVSKFPQNHTSIYGNKVLTVTPRTKELDSEVLAIIQRNLIPSFNYNINTFSDDLWDVYLLVFKNILLSENIQYRKEIKLNRDAKLKELSENRDDSYEEHHKSIMAEYTEKIDSLKQQYIFKIVNYLNWLHYNNENKDIAWAGVLLRLNVITKNIHHDEQYKHDETEFIKYIQQHKHTTKRELLELYVAILVYRYQFIEHSIIEYDKSYIETIIRYLTDTLPTFEEYISYLLNDIYNNIHLLHMLVPTDKMMEHVKCICLSKFSYKVRSLYDTLKKYYDEDVLLQHEIPQRIDLLSKTSEICQLFNKMNSNNYKQIATQLQAYDKGIVLTCFNSTITISYGPYTKYILQYMITYYGKELIDNTLSETLTNMKSKPNQSINSLYGLLLAVLGNELFLTLSTDKLTTLIEAGNNQPIETIIPFILSEAKNKLKTARGYDKFQLETLISNLE